MWFFLQRGVESGLLDSNQRPHAPQTRALTYCAKPRRLKSGAKIVLYFGISKKIGMNILSSRIKVLLLQKLGKQMI